MITNKQIASIARESKRVCSCDGYGNRVVVWPDGSTSEAVSDTDLTALLHADGSRTYPVARLRYPLTRAQVREILAGDADPDVRRAVVIG